MWQCKNLFFFFVLDGVRSPKGGEIDTRGWEREKDRKRGTGGSRVPSYVCMCPFYVHDYNAYGALPISLSPSNYLSFFFFFIFFDSCFQPNPFMILFSSRWTPYKVDMFAFFFFLFFFGCSDTLGMWNNKKKNYLRREISRHREQEPSGTGRRAKELVWSWKHHTQREHLDSYHSWWTWGAGIAKILQWENKRLGLVILSLPFSIECIPKQNDKSKRRSALLYPPHLVLLEIHRDCFFLSFGSCKAKKKKSAHLAVTIVDTRTKRDKDGGPKKA